MPAPTQTSLVFVIILHNRKWISAETLPPLNVIGPCLPAAALFRPVIAFLGYDPTPGPTGLADRVERKRRALGVTMEQVAQYLGWDSGSLRHYLDGRWRLS